MEILVKVLMVMITKIAMKNKMGHENDLRLYLKVHVTTSYIVFSFFLLN